MLSRLRLALLGCSLPGCSLDGHSLDGHSLRRSSARRHRPRRSAFTLLEVLIATAITLLMMLSLVQVFKIIGDSMKQGRAALQMNNTLRAVTFRLRNDLSNLTVRVDPPADQGSGGGYLEYFDGSMTDYTVGNVNSLLNRFGDTDDILMFTARAGDSWFTGQVPGSVVGGGTNPVTLTSQLAEICVFARPVLTNTTGTTHFDDVDSNDLPDGYQLYYRVLLIRPDLNDASGRLTLTVGADSPTAMSTAFSNCDLSMHRVFDTNDGSVVDDFVAANSLEDLALPVNRFAHYQFPIPGTVSKTMPLIVLDPIPITEFPLFRSLPYPDIDPTATAMVGSAGNFLHPAFLLSGPRLGEDILATNLLAFDVKGYDSGVPVIGLAGPDGLPSPLTTANVGEDGSDDVILTPNDPGYGEAMSMSTGVIVSYGSYVDLLWGRKVLNALNSSGTIAVSELSGLQSSGTFSEGLLRSGKVICSNGSGALVSPQVMQATFDTWTTMYESNGTLETELDNTDPTRGVIAVNAQVYQNGASGNNAINLKPSESWRQTALDGGTDGIDNGTGGVDEAAERETSPPFPVKLRGIKISVRIEDIATRQVKQMSVANEFVTQ